MIGKKVLTKIVLLLIVLFGVTILTFVYTNLSPVDAAEALAVRRYSRPTAEQIELVREELGLDKPILQQYGSWLWNALHGDFGNSYNTGRSIVEELTASIQPTLIMAVLALLFSTVICIPLGVLSASRKGGLADKSIYLFGIICMSLPNYWIGFMLLLAFAVYLPIFSIMGADSLKDFVLPALALAIPTSAGTIRVFRSSLLDGYNSDFVLYARARGVSEWKIANMVSRFALPPLITMLAQSFTYPSTGVYDNVVLFFQSAMEELGIEIKTNPIDLMAFMQQVFMEDNYEITAYMSYWFPYDPYTFVANMYPSTDYSDPSGIYSTDPQVAKALATMSDEEAKALIAGLYNTDDPAVVQEIFTEALNSANESSVIIPLNYRNEYAVFNSDVIESYTFNSIPNHVDVAAIHLK